MEKHPIRDLVDYQTVEDIFIELMDNKSFACFVVDQHQTQHVREHLYHNPWNRNFFTPEKKVVRVCEMEKSEFDIPWERISENEFSSNWHNPFRFTEKTYEIEKTKKSAVIDIHGHDCHDIHKNDESLKETIKRIQSFLGDEMTGYIEKRLSPTHIQIVIDFNSYKATQLS